MPKLTPLEFLEAVYNNAQLPLHTRLKAACGGAQYVHPTYKAMALVPMGGDFATRLERTIERSQAPKLTEARSVEHAASELRPTAMPEPKPKPRPNQFFAGRLARRRIK